MQAEHYQYIVIGGGSGGYAAARTAREVLDRVAIVDGADTLGGLCILRGCMPSKTLIYSAEVLHHAAMGKTFGLNIPNVSVDMPALHQRKLNIIREFAEYREEQLESKRFTLFRNKARFLDPQTIELDNGQRLTADHFMIATGSEVAVPKVPGLADVPCWTSDDVLDLSFLPERVIILGGGIVACELAQFLHRIGSEVTLVQRSPHLLKQMPEAASITIEKSFRQEGIDLYTDTNLHSVSHADGLFRIVFEKERKTVELEAPHLLNALGRVPATRGLHLEAAEIEIRPSGHIACNEFQQTTNPKVYSCGDVAGPHQIVHVAILQGEAAARHATDRAAKPVHYDALVSVAFTDPQVATAGLTEEQIQQRSIDYISADYPFYDHGKSILMEAKHGYVKVYADRKGIVLGAECVGKDAGELIHALAVAIQLRANVRDLLQVHWYHPTLSEIWTYPLEDILEQL